MESGSGDGRLVAGAAVLVEAEQALDEVEANGPDDPFGGSGGGGRSFL